MRDQDIVLGAEYDDGGLVLIVEGCEQIDEVFLDERLDMTDVLVLMDYAADNNLIFAAGRSTNDNIDLRLRELVEAFNNWDEDLAEKILGELIDVICDDEAFEEEGGMDFYYEAYEGYENDWDDPLYDAEDDHRFGNEEW